jgi:NitT/TauT family transport system substrate-binding protein/putative hydroxymethylpyrimidine transport system substrate-binding protein
VLDTILAEGGVDAASVDRQVIGFNSVPLLAAGKIDAATAFWNAEGVDLKRMGVPTREFRVDEFGAPRYPELVVAASVDDLSDEFRMGDQLPKAAEERGICAFQEGLESGYELLEENPLDALYELLEASPFLGENSQRAQMESLTQADAFSGPQGPANALIDRLEVEQWHSWASDKGIVPRAKAKDWAVEAVIHGPLCSPPPG